MDRTQKYTGSKQKDFTPEQLEALRNGDQDVFRVIYLHYATPVKDFLQLLTRSEDEAKEITQEIFVTIWEKRAQINPEKSFKGYLYTIARNAAFKLFEQKKVHDRYLSNSYPQAEYYSSDEKLIAEETEILMQIAINRMPPQRKKIFEMSRGEGLKSTEIAERLNLSRHTVDNHLAAAKKDLKDLLMLFAALFVIQ